jgi:hypothetical protein
VSVPYVGWVSQMTGCAPTLAQAMVPYPQFCGTIQGLNEFHAGSIYHSFQGRLERRFSNGLYLLTSLTVAKLFTNASYSTQSTNSNATSFSPYDTSGRQWAVSPDNVPVTLQVSAVYDLPFGKNKQFLNHGGLTNLVVGGWQLSPLYRYEYGTPFTFTSSNCPTSSLVGAFRETCVPAVVAGSAMAQGRNGFSPYARGGKLFNVSAFETDFSRFGYTGTGKAVSNLYGPSYYNMDVAFTKNTRITERVNFKLMANFFNAFNYHAFINQSNGVAGAFVTDVAASGNSFGTWNGNVSAPRTIQFAGRVEF